MKVYITVLLGLIIAGSLQSLAKPKGWTEMIAAIIGLTAFIIGIIALWSLP